MADRRNIIVPLLILTFIFFSPDPGRNVAGPVEYRLAFQDIIDEEQHSLEELQNSTYIPQRFRSKGGYGLNLTGLETDRGYAWEDLPAVQEAAQERLEYALGDSSASALELARQADDGVPLYGNVTGFVHGKWVRSKLEAVIANPHLNLSDYSPLTPFGPLPPQPFGRNVTGKGGDLRLNLHERDPSRFLNDQLVARNATDIDMEMSIVDDISLEEHDLRLYGVYFPAAGQAILTTTTSKFDGIYMLPHFTLSDPMFNISQTLLNASITQTIHHQIGTGISNIHPWSSRLDGTGDSPYTIPQCELIVYLQQLPPMISSIPSSSAVLSFLERELRFPTGAFLPSAPALRLSMLAFSPDCGYVLESQGPPDYPPQDGDHLIGSKTEIIHRNGRKHLLLFTVTLGLQLILLVRQMREASTPSTRSKISFYTVAMLALGDGFTTLTFLLTSMFVGDLWVNSIGSAFLSFISVSFFGMRLILDIWNVQAPERMRAAREEAEENRQRMERAQEALQRIRLMRDQAAELRAQAAAAAGENQPPPAQNAPDNIPNTTTTPSNEQPSDDPSQTIPADSANTPASAQPASDIQQPPGALPLPVTAPRPVDTGASPFVMMPSDQEGFDPAGDFGDINPREFVPEVPSFGSLYTRFYLILLAAVFLSLNAASWPAPFRRVYFTSVALVYLSFWLPQLHRNVQRNCRHALNWEYVIGQSVLRLVPFAYFYGYPRNILFASPDYISLTILALWLWIQVVLLVSQEIIGPRWFIKSDWAPPAYDYHPVLREDEEGANMPIGFSQATAAAASSAPSSPSVERRNSVAKGDDKDKDRRGKRVFDCAICMQDLEVQVVEADGAGASDAASLGAGLLARRAYMVTPCRHIFHSACLEGWMKFRLQCPICRETLPPL